MRVTVGSEAIQGLADPEHPSNASMPWRCVAPEQCEHALAVRSTRAMRACHLAPAFRSSPPLEGWRVSAGVVALIHPMNAKAPVTARLLPAALLTGREAYWQLLVFLVERPPRPAGTPPGEGNVNHSALPKYIRGRCSHSLLVRTNHTQLGGSSVVIANAVKQSRI